LKRSLFGNLRFVFFLFQSFFSSSWEIASQKRLFVFASALRLRGDGLTVYMLAFCLIQNGKGIISCKSVVEMGSDKDTWVSVEHVARFAFASPRDALFPDIYF
jgi:hypothetical protein